MIHLISYDLRKPVQHYKELHSAIKNLGAWAKPLESVWLVDTRFSAAQISTRLRSYLDQDDSLLVIETGRDSAGCLSSQEVWNWINSRKAA